MTAVRRDAGGAAWIAAGGVGLIAFGLCLWRLMPGVGFWDTAEFQMVLPVMGTAHPTGYPTYVLLGWLASLVLTPIGEPAFRINLLSAILVGVGAGLTVDLARRLSGSLLLGIATGLGIAVTPIVWAIGTHADPHALHFALLVTIVWLLVRWEHARRGNPLDPAARPDHPRRADRWLLAAAVVTGLSTGNHSLTLLLGPPIILYVFRVAPDTRHRRRFIAACLAAAAIPAVLVRLEMPLRAGWFRAPFVYADPSTWDGFWYVTLGQQFHGWVTNPLGDWPRRIDELTRLAGQQLGPLAPLILIAFAVTAVRLPRYALLSGSAALITCFFNSIYPDGAIDRYYIGPAFFAWTWLAVLAATVVGGLVGSLADPGVRGPGPDRARRLGSAGVLRVVAIVAAAAVLIAPSLVGLSQRARFVDRSEDRVAERWTDDVMTDLQPDAVVISWWSYSTPLWYGTIVEGRRPDILIIDDRNRVDLNLLDLDQVIDLYIAKRPVYVIRNDPAELTELAAHYTLSPLGSTTATNVFRVNPTAAAVLPADGPGR
ncbi:MAG TPA: DUF2723 domain-containing protein [Candidatus Limnocylindrales bacterium]|nr:DUF2723 domain-containing protein [Candidatus Limnocylindrales bacterium]